MANLIPLTRPLLGPEELSAVAETLQSGMLTQGPKVAEFEKAIGDWLGVPHVVALSSGTTALHLGVILAGIQPGDEVIVPSYTFIATANAILYAGAVPVFIDIDPKTFNLNPEILKSLITPRTRAVIAVDQFGLPCDLNEIEKVCKDFGLALIQDSACALGSEYKNERVGSRGNLICLSFHPRKSITTGEGGALICADQRHADRARVLRAHGMERPGVAHYLEMGFNYRLSDIQAAVGVVQMKRLPGIVQRRREIAKTYSDAFRELTNISPPHEPSHCVHSYQSYAVTVGDGRARDLISNLADHGIAAKEGIAPIHAQQFMKKFAANPLPHTEAAHRDSVILPLYPQMTNLEVRSVIDRVIDFSKKSSKGR